MQIGKIVKAMEITEGAGVTVHRTIGTPALKNLDPFLLLDHFSSDDPGEYIAGFPDHPHRGFITFTYMLDGHMLHQDSMGNRGDLLPGGIQWMKAASGVIHSEMPQQENGLMRGFQLWINLPASEKMSDPAYQELPAGKIPVVDEAGVTVKVLCGEYGGMRGPIDDPHTGVNYLDVMLAPGRSFAVSPGSDMHTLMYLFEGGLTAEGAPVTQHAALIPVPGSDIAVTASEAGARFILVSGRPLNESVVQYGPFVMNTQDEIHQAFEDYRTGKLVRIRASVTG